MTKKQQIDEIIEAFKEANVLTISREVAEKLEKLSDIQFENFKKLRFLKMSIGKGCLFFIVYIIISFITFISFFDIGSEKGAMISFFVSFFGIFIIIFYSTYYKNNINSKILNNWLSELSSNKTGEVIYDDKKILPPKYSKAKYKAVEVFIIEFEKKLEEQKMVKEQETAKKKGKRLRTCRYCGYQEEDTSLGDKAVLGIIDTIRFVTNRSYSEELAKKNLPAAMSYMNELSDDSRKRCACPQCGADDFYIIPR